MGIINASINVKDMVDKLLVKYRDDYSTAVYKEFKSRVADIFNDLLVGRIDERDCIIRITAVDSEFSRCFNKKIKK
jgi:hypothetical protein